MSHLDAENRHGESPANTAAEAGGANISRRKLAKLGLGAPVIMSLASKQALAGQCLSNMLSGNLSNPNRGHCSKGWSPGGWGQPGGMIYNCSTITAWNRAGFQYGTLKANCSASQWDCYQYGSKLSAMPSALNKDSLDSNLTLREVLNVHTETLTRHLVTAYLNAALGEYEPNYQYALTKQQVVDLATGVLFMPQPYVSLKDFLGSTWD